MSPSRAQILTAVQVATQLPAFPETVLRIEQELRRPMPELGTIARLVKQDAALTARFLQVANSAAYRRAKAISSVDRAVVHLGLHEAHQIAVGALVIDRYADWGGHDPMRFWRHCLAVALTTDVVMRFAKVSFSSTERETAFLAGLLHDIGVLALYHFCGKAYGELQRTIAEEGGTCHAAEHREWGIDHGEVGAQLVRKWRLDEAVALAVRLHHRPWEAEGEHARLTQLVHMSNVICNNQGLGRYGEGFPEAFDEGSWEALGLSLEQVPEIVEQALGQAERSEMVLFGLDSKKGRA